MKKSKLISLISTFSYAEWKRLGEFINSPYFNNNELVIKLYKFLDLNKPLFEINKNKVFKAIFPLQAYDDSKLSYVMSDLLKLSEKFLSIEHFMNDSSQQKRLALMEYSNRGLKKHYHFLHAKASSELNMQKLGPTSLLNKLLLSEVEISFFTKQKVRRYDPSIQDTYNALNEYYYSQLLKYTCSLLNYSIVVSGDFIIEPISRKLIDELIKDKEDYSPLIRVYLCIYQTLSTNEDENGKHFKTLMNLLEESQELIEKEELRELYLFTINFCARKTRKGENEYVPIMLKMYDEGIKNNALIENGYLSHWTYTNVVRLGLREGRYEWVEKFIDEYKGLLPPETFDDAYHLNLADLRFNQENYDAVLDHLIRLQFSDPIYHLTSRLLLIKTFYEREDTEALLSLLASFTIYLKRNKGSSVVIKKTFLNFCTILHQLLKNNPKKRSQLLEKIKTIQPLTERAWLLKVWEEQKL